MKNKLLSSLGTRLAVAVGLTISGLLLNFTYPSQFVSTFLLLLATIITGLPIARNALSALRYKVIGIDLLVTIAVIGAVFIGEYWEAAIVAVLFTLGHYLEARTFFQQNA